MAYQADAEIATDAEFMTWLGELEGLMRRHESLHGWCPYDLPLADSTGLQCWHDYYKDGYTARDALNEDLSAFSD